LSGFAHVAPLKTKKAAVVGRAMICIMSFSVVPEILQSDNDSEFLGNCIAYMKQYFLTVNIVKVNHGDHKHKVAWRKGMSHLREHWRSGW
jgi:hypothetical protein